MTTDASRPTDASDVRVLLDLGTDECWRLVASRTLGRLAWSGTHGPAVVPVNYRVTYGAEGRALHVRTTAYSELARECDDSPVAFEVDDVDEGRRTGWSVVLRGHAHIDYRAPLAPLAEDADWPAPWPSGARPLRVSIVIHQVTGRFVRRPGLPLP